MPFMVRSACGGRTSSGACMQWLAVLHCPHFDTSSSMIACACLLGCACPIPSLHISAHARSGRSRAMYCYDCKKSLTSLAPMVTLPFAFSIITHQDEQVRHPMRNGFFLTLSACKGSYAFISLHSLHTWVAATVARCGA